MLSSVVDFLRYASVIALFVFLIVLTVKRDFADERAQTTLAEPENRTAESVTEIFVRRYVTMSPDERFGKIVDELNRIDKLAVPREHQLNGVRECLTQVQSLRRRVGRTHRTERTRLDDAIAWLEKPLADRRTAGELHGPARTRQHSYDEYEESRCSLEDVKKYVRLITTTVTAGAPEDAKTSTDRDDAESDHANVEMEYSEPPETTMKLTFEMPKIAGLHESARLRALSRRLWPVAKFWSSESLDNLLESAKLWYVVCVLIRRIAFDSANAEKAVGAVFRVLRKFVDVQTKVDGEQDRTTIALAVFPDGDEEIKDFVTRFVAKAISVFEY